MLLDSLISMTKFGLETLALVINGYREHFCVAQIPYLTRPWLKKEFQRNM